MNPLLLDTHIWVWSMMAPARLAPRVRKALTSPETERWISPISVWEVFMLCDKGRLELNPDAASWVAAALSRTQHREAPLTHDVAVAAATITLAHRDPADRFLAATARVYDLTLVTADEKLLAGSGYRVLANR